MVANREIREVIDREPTFVGCPVERYVRKTMEEEEEDIFSALPTLYTDIGYLT